MSRGAPQDIERLAAAWRQVTAPADFANRVRAASVASPTRPRRRWLWPALAAAAALIVAVNLPAPEQRPAGARVAGTLPSVAQITTRVPGPAASKIRLPALGTSLRVPTPAEDPEISKARTR